MARDANDQYYPLASAVVETVNKDSWNRFLNELLVDIVDFETHKWVLISNRKNFYDFVIIYLYAIIN